MTTSKTDFDTKDFRRALGNFATGVTIVTACTPDSTKVGVTASSFNSLSMDPPLILWSSTKASPSSKQFEIATHFAVNILASDQMDMSNHFARQQEDKFDGIEWEAGIGGAPIFPDCAGRLQCESYDKLDGGDHWIFVGRVLSFDDYGRAPLCFHQGSYSMVFNHPGSDANSSKTALHHAEEGRMGNHGFFLMLRAVRAYQERYRPKLETLGLGLIESRVLLVLNDMPELSAEELSVHVHSPVNEAHEAIQSLIERGMIEDLSNGYLITDSGIAKADQCWGIAQSHATEMFERFSSAEVNVFNKVLRHLISS